MAQQMIGRKMISEIMSMSAARGSEEDTFTVLAKIDSIYPHAGWCYVTCHQCSKKIKVVNGLFVCRHCDVPCRYPMVRYRIHVCVSDYTGRSIFTIFNPVAENMLDSSANKFYRRLGFGRFPLGLVNLVDRFFAFRIRLPDYTNDDSDFHNYRVVGLFENDPTPDLKGLWVKPGKVVMSKKRLRRGVAPAGSGPSRPVLSVESSGSTSKLGVGAKVSTPEKTSGLKKKRG